MSFSDHIAAIRTDYRQAALDEQMVGDDPLAFFTRWFGEAEDAKIEEVNAMTLATTDAAGKPHARIVLLKGLDARGLQFFTNYESDKGQQMSASPDVAVVFFWKELERQVRMEGRIVKLTEAENEEYFRSRPEGSRIGAWASPQSQVIDSREVLEENAAAYTRQFEGKDIPLPPHWGGYCIIPSYIEFWQGRSSRLHDRIVFEQVTGAWQRYRIAP